MGQVVVTLTGDEARLLRSLDRVVAKERELAQQGKETGEAHAKAADNALSSIDGLLGGLSAWGAALAVVKAGLDQVAEAQEKANKARERASTQGQTDAAGLRQLAQLSGGDAAKYQRLSNEARDTAKKEGVSLGMAAQQTAALERAGVTGQGRGQLVADLGNAGIDPKVLVAAAALQKTFGGKTDADSLRAVVGGTLALKQPGDINAFLDTAAGGAELAKRKGLSESDYIGQLAKIAQNAGSVEKGAHQLRSSLEGNGGGHGAVRDALAGGYDRPDLTNSRTLGAIVDASESDPTVRAANAKARADAANAASLENEGVKRTWADVAILDRETRQRLGGGNEETIQHNSADAEAELQGRSFLNPMRYVVGAKKAVYGDMLTDEGDAVAGLGPEAAGERMRRSAEGHGGEYPMLDMMKQGSGRGAPSADPSSRSAESLQKIRELMERHYGSDPMIGARDK